MGCALVPMSVNAFMAIKEKNVINTLHTLPVLMDLLALVIHVYVKVDLLGDCVKLKYVIKPSQTVTFAMIKDNAMQIYQRNAKALVRIALNVILRMKDVQSVQMGL